METLLADLSVQLLPIAARVVATAIVVMGVSLLVQHAGPALGGIAAGLPIVMGPGFFFLIGHHPPDFLHDAAVATLMALVATLIFVACFIVVAKRAGPFASVGAAILAWCVVAAVTGMHTRGCTAPVTANAWRRAPRRSPQTQISSFA